jgi:hypothetical protein
VLHESIRKEGHFNPRRSEKLMKGIIALVVLTLGMAAGCTRVIERPVASSPSVVTTPAISERVVERPSAPAAAGSTAQACTWASQSYSHGGMSCQEHSQFRCNSGAWERTELSC